MTFQEHMQSQGEKRRAVGDGSYKFIANRDELKKFHIESLKATVEWLEGDIRTVGMNQQVSKDYYKAVDDILSRISTIKNELEDNNI